jgi:hypothetical protein
MFFTPMNVSAATGEMGTGIPSFGVYAAYNYTKVWSFANATINFPAGCTSLTVSVATLTMDGYKVALSQMTAARISGRKIRFHAHAERDGGCGVDYLELL